MHLSTVVSLRVIIILGLVLRIALLFIDFSFDVNNHISWAQDLGNRGPRGFFETPSAESYGTIYPNYPPLALLLFAPFYPLYHWLFDLVWQLNVTIPVFPSGIVTFMEQRHFLAGLMKIPAVLADFGLAGILGLTARRLIPHRKHILPLTVALVLLHPTFFYNSAYWGQIDSIPLFFVALALYLILFLKRPYLSALTMTAAILVKPTALVFVLVYALLFLHQFWGRVTMKAVIISLFLFWLSFQPFAQTFGGIMYPFQVYKEGILDTQSIGAVSNAAYSAWVLYPQLFFVPADTSLVGNISYQTIGTAIGGIFMLSIAWIMWKRRTDQIMVLFALGLVAFSSFLFLTKMHERYMILILPFLLIPALKYKNVRYAWIIISIISFLNLYKSWPLPRIEILAEGLNTPPVVVVLAAVNVLTFFYLIRVYLNLTLHKQA